MTNHMKFKKSLLFLQLQDVFIIKGYQSYKVNQCGAFSLIYSMQRDN